MDVILLYHTARTRNVVMRRESKRTRRGWGTKYQTENRNYYTRQYVIGTPA